MKNKIICFVGAGGKTTTMYSLAEQYTAAGKRVLVGTTTHIMKPDRFFAENEEQVKALWENGHYAVIGTPEPETGKLTAADPNLQKRMAGLADLVLLEADGAKGFDCKVPSGREPVIPEECTAVVGIMGMRALEKPLGEVCFRFASDGAWIGKDPEDLLDEETAAKILLSERGTRKNVGGRPYYVLLTQCIDERTRKQAERIRELLLQGAEDGESSRVCKVFIR